MDDVVLFWYLGHAGNLTIVYVALLRTTKIKFQWPYTSGGMIKVKHFEGKSTCYLIAADEG